jgi:hypothetical protein
MRPTVEQTSLPTPVPVKDTIIDVIEEPAPGVVVVTEPETIRTATPISSGPEPKRGRRSPRYATRTVGDVAVRQGPRADVQDKAISVLLSN